MTWQCRIWHILFLDTWVNVGNSQNMEETGSRGCQGPGRMHGNASFRGGGRQSSQSAEELKQFSDCGFAWHNRYTEDNWTLSQCRVLGTSEYNSKDENWNFSKYRKGRAHRLPCPWWDAEEMPHLGRRVKGRGWRAESLICWRAEAIFRGCGFKVKKKKKNLNKFVFGFYLAPHLSPAGYLGRLSWVRLQ